MDTPNGVVLMRLLVIWWYSRGYYPSASSQHPICFFVVKGSVGGGRRTVDGGRWTADGGWRTADGERRAAGGGGWRTAAPGAILTEIANRQPLSTLADSVPPWHHAGPQTGPGSGLRPRVFSTQTPGPSRHRPLHGPHLTPPPRPSAGGKKSGRRRPADAGGGAGRSLPYRRELSRIARLSDGRGPSTGTGTGGTTDGLAVRVAARVAGGGAEASDISRRSAAGPSVGWRGCESRRWSDGRQPVTVARSRFTAPPAIDLVDIRTTGRQTDRWSPPISDRLPAAGGSVRARRRALHRRQKMGGGGYGWGVSSRHPLRTSPYQLSHTAVSLTAAAPGMRCYRIQIRTGGQVRHAGLLGIPTESATRAGLKAPMSGLRIDRVWAANWSFLGGCDPSWAAAVWFCMALWGPGCVVPMVWSRPSSVLSHAALPGSGGPAMVTDRSQLCQVPSQHVRGDLSEDRSPATFSRRRRHRVDTTMAVPSTPAAPAWTWRI